MVKGLEELANQLTYNLWYREDTEYSIVENFKIKGKRQYTLHNIEAEIINGVIMFIDESGELLNNNCIIRGFLESSVDKVKIYNNTTKIDFKSGGYIIIEVIL
jgi:hypothetical protein